MAFVTGGASLRPVTKHASKSTCGRTRFTVMNKVDDFEMWKTQAAGGFPGGEGFFKKWIEEGMTGYVPGLEEEMQVGNKPEKEAPADAKAQANSTEKKSGWSFPKLTNPLARGKAPKVNNTPTPTPTPTPTVKVGDKTVNNTSAASPPGAVTPPAPPMEPYVASDDEPELVMEVDELGRSVLVIKEKK